MRTSGSSARLNKRDNLKARLFDLLQTVFGLDKVALEILGLLSGGTEALLRLFGLLVDLAPAAIPLLAPLGALTLGVFEDVLLFRKNSLEPLRLILPSVTESNTDELKQNAVEMDGAWFGFYLCSR